MSTAKPGLEPDPDIQAAPDKLLALAAAMRPAWDHAILTAAILAARQAGWDVDDLAETIRLMRRPDGSPWDLKRAAASPLARAAPPPGTERQGSDRARAALGLELKHGGAS